MTGCLGLLVGVSFICSVSPVCVETQLCVQGAHWSPEVCACVPDRPPHRVHNPYHPHVPRAPHPPHAPHTPGYLSPEQACVNSGGTVSNGLCCGSVGDFPNTCSIGACGCAPGASHQVRLCQCAAGTCFDGAACIAR